MSAENWILQPGSDAALDAGCTCPVLDNGHGRGRGGDGYRYGWIVVEGCPLHGRKRDEAEEAEEDRGSNVFRPSDKTA